MHGFSRGAQRCESTAAKRGGVGRVEKSARFVGARKPPSGSRARGARRKSRADEGCYGRARLSWEVDLRPLGAATVLATVALRQATRVSLHAREIPPVAFELAQLVDVEPSEINVH